MSGDGITQRSISVALRQILQELETLPAETMYRRRYEPLAVISEEEGFKNEFKLFRKSVADVMEHLSVAVKREAPLFAFKFVLSGSCSEYTKVVKMDEADALCVFSHEAWKYLTVHKHEEVDYSFIKLESEELMKQYPQLAKQHPKLFDETFLSVHGIFQQFYSLVRKHIAEALKNQKHIYIVESTYILHNDYSISHLDLAWSGEVIKWQRFSLDIVPAFPVHVSELPGPLNHHDLLDDLIYVPKWTASLIGKGYAQKAFQLGFSYPEKKLFCAMPIALRQAYKLTKVLVHECVVIDGVSASDFVSSYMLKCKTFECFSDEPDFTGKVKTFVERDLVDDPLVEADQVLEWADKIFLKLEKSIKECSLESFFLPGSNLVSSATHREDYRALLYARLCRAMLNSPSSSNTGLWTLIAQAVADQLIDAENLHHETFVEDIRALLDIGLDESYRSSNGCSVLFYMVQHDLLDGVVLLLERQASVDNVDGRGNSAMKVAAENKKSDILKFLQEAVAGKNDEVASFV